AEGLDEQVAEGAENPVTGEDQHAKGDQQARKEAQHLFVDLGGGLEDADQQAAEQARHHQHADHQDNDMDGVGDEVDSGVGGQHFGTWQVNPCSLLNEAACFCFCFCFRRSAGGRLVLARETVLARPLIYVAALSVARPTGCALHGASLFLVWPRKSNQKEGHPCIRVLLRKTSLAPVLLRGSSRRDIHVPLRLSRHPCLEPPCATPALGLLKWIKDRVAWGLVGWKTAKHFPPQSARPSKLARQDRWVSFALPTLRRSHTDDLLHGPADATESPLSEGRTESAWRGASGMDAARGVKGHGWPLYAGPRNVDGVREVSRSETRMQGQAFLLTFFGAGRPATEKSESPCKAKPVARAEESVAPYKIGRASCRERA